MNSSERDALAAASAQVGLNAEGAKLIRRHVNTVYVLPAAAAVARMASKQRSIGAELGIATARWLRSHGFPATEPLDVEQPVLHGEHVVTFWRYYPQGDRTLPSTGALAEIVRELHQHGSPPFPVPQYQPLESFRDELERCGPAVLWQDEYTFLQERAADLLQAYDSLDSALGHGLIHADARTGNLLWDGEQVVLGDWDSVSTGPRELDLIPTYQGVRYGRPEAKLSEFAASYGWDVRRWRGYATLRDMRDLHTLSAPLRIAEIRPDVADELHHRVRSLQFGEGREQWSSF
ncbi:aminoglycoside phosphotransferase [Longispora fulva]|uniref:Aminoglycoside phosphotransferase domain-containing protein n=1 Tax=Longispora fulva TaxID=619741 RepID=A0A8J7GRG1_9ACTN|nr:aminoglycoside phosphotransferase family protein [Longispora fulva]MBG6136828.1 hypothetical protein [Longispora fulva]GIG59998.1 aminoglycoside phosphotransferase [Longispora fulva]